MKMRFEELKAGGSVRSLAVALTLVPLTLLPVVAGAVETDRVTVEDPATGTVMFRVTSAGNVTGASFTGNGAGLSNVAHYKGAWSSATAYLKDDVVLYGGSSYIALAASSNAQPNLTPASWAVFAQQGPAGAAGAIGATGATGPQGPQGPQGTAGSPDTQAQILSKIATPTDNASLNIVQGPTEPYTATKLRITDRTGVDRLTYVPNGYLYNSGFVAEFHNRVFSDTAVVRPVWASERSRGTTTAPTAVQLNDKLGSYAFSGHDGSGYQTGALLEGFVDGPVTAGSVPSRLSFVTGSSISARAERLVVKSSGNVGIGTASPTQALEINGGMRMNTAAGRPGCDSTTRGTFWLTQKGAGENDTLEVCIKDATEAYLWKAVW